MPKTKPKFYPDRSFYSDGGVYRFWLHRSWEYMGKPDKFREGYVVFIDLNPHGDGEHNYLTRYYHLANSWGYSQFVLVSLFNLCIARPLELLQAANPVGEKYATPHYFWRYLEGTKLIVPCWGNWGTHQNRSYEVLAEIQRRGMLKKCGVFDLTSSGQPLRIAHGARGVSLHMVQLVDGELDWVTESKRSRPRKADIKPVVKPTKPIAKPTPDQFVYVIDSAGADLTDPGVVQMYSLIKQHSDSNSITVRVRGKDKVLKKGQGTKFFFRDSDLQEYLTDWIQTETAETENKLTSLQNLSGLEFPELLRIVSHKVTKD